MEAEYEFTYADLDQETKDYVDGEFNNIAGEDGLVSLEEALTANEWSACLPCKLCDELIKYLSIYKPPKGQIIL